MIHEERNKSEERANRQINLQVELLRGEFEERGIRGEAYAKIEDVERKVDVERTCTGQLRSVLEDTSFFANERLSENAIPTMSEGFGRRLRSTATAYGYGHNQSQLPD